MPRHEHVTLCSSWHRRDRISSLSPKIIDWYCACGYCVLTCSFKRVQGSVSGAVCFFFFCLCMGEPCRFFEESRGSKWVVPAISCDSWHSELSINSFCMLLNESDGSHCKQEQHLSTTCRSQSHYVLDKLPESRRCWSLHRSTAQCRHTCCSMLGCQLGDVGSLAGCGAQQAGVAQQRRRCRG